MLPYKRSLLVIGVLLAAAGVRAAALASLAGTVYFDQLLWDERVYHEWAASIARGTFESDSVYDFAPLPAYLNAFIYTLFEPDVFWIRILNLILGVATCYFIYVLGHRLSGFAVGLISGLAAAFYGPLVLYSIVPLKTSLSLFCFSGAMALMVFVLGKIQSGRGLSPGILLLTGALGALMGLTINVRANFAAVAVLVPFILWFAVRRVPETRSKPFLLITPFVFGLVLTLSPFVIRNMVVAGEFALTTSQTGRNLYFGNDLENPDPYYRPVRFASSVPDEQAVHFVIEASRRLGRSVTPSEASEYWTREVLRFAVEEPAKMAAKIGRKTLVVVNRFEASDHYQLDFLSDFVPVLKTPFLGFGLVFPLSVIGLVFHRRDERIRGLALTWLAYSATLVVFVTNTRYRLPVVAILIPLAVLGSLELLKAVRARGWKKTAAIISMLAIAIGIENLPVRGVGDMTAYYNTHALMLDRSGDTKGAVEYFEKSMKMKGAYSPVARLFLAGKYYERGDAKLALKTAEEIDNRSFAASAKYALLGDLSVNLGDLNSARDFYVRSLEINCGQRRIRRALIDIYMKQRNLGKAAEQGKQLRGIEDFFK